jgi:hypothetical protein
LNIGSQLLLIKESQYNKSYSTHQMKSSLAFLTLFVALVASEGALFNWAASDYKISGQNCGTSFNYIDGQFLQVYSCQPVTLVINPAKQRAALLLGIGGNFYHLANETFVSGVPTLGGFCGYSTAYTFATFVSDYSKALSIDDRNKTYFGLVNGTCATEVATTFDTNNRGEVLKWVFAQKFPLPGICLVAWGNIELERSSIVRNGNYDADFVRSAPCDNAANNVPYCPTAYFFSGQTCF